MAAVDTSTGHPRWRVDRATDLRIAVGLVGLAAALFIRVSLAGAAGVRSVAAGLVFGAAVAALAGATGVRSGSVRVGHRDVIGLIGYGVLGAAVLCLPAAIRHADGATVSLPLQGYPPWALGVAVVAIAEEALLRGSLFTALQHRAGTSTAIAVTSVAFALVHIPLYGTSVVPLDLAVGVWLGVLRGITGSVTVPAVAHTLADLVGWWVR